MSDRYKIECAECLDWLKRQPDDSVDLVVCRRSELVELGLVVDSGQRRYD